ncbi:MULTISPECIES: efflux RND transporter periplasmic adaptor subunit [Methylobacterium]|uniref:efflux RND transporter periplasmic adaptor subunit n=1 Tax=Methylobacterium TaxID=407 RepID=UPI0013EDB45E|nr:efflux RND transporter periplasmic adaptor subunit [Methylobacterium sp. DB0501]NGM36604.1 efflux RND transporter periplasmic adaptor subunit [Methylobacterium sp. DB0501]
MLLAVETVARIAGSEVRPRQRTNEAPALRPSRPGGRPPWRGLALLVVLVGLAGAGWTERDAAGTALAPLLAKLGLTAPAPAPAAAESTTPADPNLVTLDAAGQTRIGLAFGTAETRRIVLPVRAPGMVAFDERRVTHLKPRTPGRVLSLAVQPGDPVRAGQTLATLDAAGLLEARNGLAEAQASLAEAQATETVAELNLKRGQDLLKVMGVAQAEVDRRRVDLAKAHAATLAAKAKVDLYAAQVQRLAPEPGAPAGTSAIVSPIDGVVTASGITLGEVVDTGSDAFTVADPSRIQVLANLYGRDIAAVKPGDTATVRAPVPDHPTFAGRVRSVNAAVDPATGTAPARIEIANPGGALRANMFVSVEIGADLGREGTTIPAAAVQQTEDGPVAFVRDADDRFEKRALSLGVQRADWVEVTKGVSPGETVATKGSFGLKAILLRSLLGSTD